MALSTADDLRSALATWGNNGTLTTSVLNTCISLFEAGFNRDIRVKGMEATLSSTALVSGAVSNPTGFLEWKELRCDEAIDYTLQPRPLEWIRSQDDTAARDPLFYAVTSTETVCWPTTGSVKGTYYKALTSLVDLTATGNWLLTSHPDIYLFGVLTETAILLEDENKAVMYRDRTRALLNDLKASDQSGSLGGGPLRVITR